MSNPFEEPTTESEEVSAFPFELNSDDTPSPFKELTLLTDEPDDESELFAVSDESAPDEPEPDQEPETDDLREWVKSLHSSEEPRCGHHRKLIATLVGVAAVAGIAVLVRKLLG